jgi:predicted dehydrogenase
MANVRLGIVGLGIMGRGHLEYLLQGKVQRVQVTALCDIVPKAMEGPPELARFDDYRALIGSGLVDAVLIATPHYQHPPITVEALGKGLHVLVEKPISVGKSDAEKMLLAYQKRPRKEQVFAAMFQQRTSPQFQQMKRLLASGELGPIQRVCWLCTHWFRSDAYYASGGWRATWRGEGGGVLVNQCPHNLDMLWWLCGTPSEVRAFCRFGKWHKIEVEDDVTAYLVYPNGATGVFVAGTGEAPGSDLLEIACDRGKIAYEGGKLTLWRSKVPVSEYCRTTRERFKGPEFERQALPVTGKGGGHAQITQNFVDAVLDGKELLAPAAEGIFSVELANAMLYSTWTDQTVKLPLDGAAFDRALQERIARGRAVNSTLIT